MDVRRFVSICLALAAAGSGPGTFATGEAPPPRPQPPAIQLSPAPPSQEGRELMRRWRHELREPLSPVLRAWEGLAHAARETPGSPLTAGCRRLGAALEALGDRRLPPAPDPAVSLHLEETLRLLGEAAGSCTHGAYFLTSWRLREAAASWRQLRGRLLLYGLSP